MFSQTLEYALRAAVWLAQNEGQPQTTQEVARATQVPAHYQSKVLQALGRAGLAQGTRGKHGGWVLTRPASRIRVLDVVNGVEPVKRIRQCPLDLKSHGVKLCPLHARMDRALAMIEESFASVTLKELLDGGGAGGPASLCESLEVLA